MNELNKEQFLNNFDPKKINSVLCRPDKNRVFFNVGENAYIDCETREKAVELFNDICDNLQEDERFFRLDRYLINVANIEDIKLEDFEAYEEYSVIVLYKGKQSDIISCDNGYDANIYYGYLSGRWKEFKANEDKKQSAEEETSE